MPRFNGAVHFEMQTNGPVVQLIITVAGHPSDVICATHFHAAQAREFAATIIGLADMIDQREGAELGGEAHRSANVILPTIDLAVPVNRQAVKVNYGLPGRGSA